MCTLLRQQELRLAHEQVKPQAHTSVAEGPSLPFLHQVVIQTWPLVETWSLLSSTDTWLTKETWPLFKPGLYADKYSMHTDHVNVSVYERENF